MSTSLRLQGLDPDDPRAVSQQIANAIRAAILRGHFAPGERLPSQTELVSYYGVARETVKAALRVLDREQLIVSRQGSGSFVRSRLSKAPDVADFLSGAFDRPHVRIDYAGWRGETLSNTLPRAIKAVADESLRLKSLHVRLLLTDPNVLAGLPIPIDDLVDPGVTRPAMVELTNRAITSIHRTVKEFDSAGRVDTGSVEVRVHRLGPSLKIYTVNGERSLIGFYPVSESTIHAADRDVKLHHPSGWEASLFEVNNETLPRPFANQACAWFESVWNTIGRHYEP